MPKIVDSDVYESARQDATSRCCCGGSSNKSGHRIVRCLKRSFLWIQKKVPLQTLGICARCRRVVRKLKTDLENLGLSRRQVRRGLLQLATKPRVVLTRQPTSRKYGRRKRLSLEDEEEPSNISSNCTASVPIFEYDVQHTNEDVRKYGSQEIGVLRESKHNEKITAGIQDSAISSENCHLRSNNTAASLHSFDKALKQLDKIVSSKMSTVEKSVSKRSSIIVSADTTSKPNNKSSLLNNKPCNENENRRPEVEDRTYDTLRKVSDSVSHKVSTNVDHKDKKNKIHIDLDSCYKTLLNKKAGIPKSNGTKQVSDNEKFITSNEADSGTTKITVSCQESYRSKITSENVLEERPTVLVDSRVAEKEETAKKKRLHEGTVPDNMLKKKKISTLFDEIKITDARKRKRIKNRFRTLFGDSPSVSETEEEEQILNKRFKRRRKKDSVDSCDSGVCTNEKNINNCIEILKDYQKAVPDSTMQEEFSEDVRKVSSRSEVSNKEKTNQSITDQVQDTEIVLKAEEKEDAAENTDNTDDGNVKSVENTTNGDIVGNTQNVTNVRSTENAETNEAAQNTSGKAENDQIVPENIVQKEVGDTCNESHVETVTTTTQIPEATTRPEVDVLLLEAEVGRNDASYKYPDKSNTECSVQGTTTEKPSKSLGNNVDSTDLGELLKMAFTETCQITSNGNVISIQENSEKNSNQSIGKEDIDENSNLKIATEKQSINNQNGKPAERICNTSNDVRGLVEGPEESSTAEKENTQPNAVSHPKLRVLSGEELGARWCPTPVHPSTCSVSQASYNAVTQSDSALRTTTIVDTSILPTFFTQTVLTTTAVNSTPTATPINPTSVATPINPTSAATPINPTSAATSVNSTSAATSVNSTSAATPINSTSAAAPINSTSAATPINPTFATSSTPAKTTVSSQSNEIFSVLGKVRSIIKGIRNSNLASDLNFDTLLTTEFTNLCRMLNSTYTAVIHKVVNKFNTTFFVAQPLTFDELFQYSPYLKYMCLREISKISSRMTTNQNANQNSQNTSGSTTQSSLNLHQTHTGMSSTQPQQNFQETIILQPQNNLAQNSISTNSTINPLLNMQNLTYRVEIQKPSPPPQQSTYIPEPRSANMYTVQGVPVEPALLSFVGIDQSRLQAAPLMNQQNILVNQGNAFVTSTFIQQNGNSMPANQQQNITLAHLLQQPSINSAHTSQQQNIHLAQGLQQQHVNPVFATQQQNVQHPQKIQHPCVNSAHAVQQQNVRPKKQQTQQNPSKRLQQQIGNPAQRIQQQNVNPAQRVQQQNVNPAQRVQQQNVNSVQRVQQQNVNPAQRVQQQNVNPAQRVQQQNVNPAQRVQQQNVNPAQRIQQQNVNPAQRVQQQNVNPAQRVQQQNVNSAQRIQQQNVNLAQRVQQQNVNSAQRIQQQNFNPAQRVQQQQNVNPAQRVQQQNVNPAQRVQQQNVNVAQRIQQQNVNAAQRVQQQTFNVTFVPQQQSINPAQGIQQRTINPIQGVQQHAINPVQGIQQQTIDPTQGIQQQNINPMGPEFQKTVFGTFTYSMTQGIVQPQGVQNSPQNTQQNISTLNYRQQPVQNVFAKPQAAPKNMLTSEKAHRKILRPPRLKIPSQTNTAGHSKIKQPKSLENKQETSTPISLEATMKQFDILKYLSDIQKLMLTEHIKFYFNCTTWLEQEFTMETWNKINSERSILLSFQTLLKHIVDKTVKDLQTKCQESTTEKNLCMDIKIGTPKKLCIIVEENDGVHCQVKVSSAESTQSETIKLSQCNNTCQEDITAVQKQPEKKEATNDLQATPLSDSTQESKPINKEGIQENGKKEKNLQKDKPDKESALHGKSRHMPVLIFETPLSNDSDTQENKIEKNPKNTTEVCNREEQDVNELKKTIEDTDQATPKKAVASDLKESSKDTVQLQTTHLVTVEISPTTEKVKVINVNTTSEDEGSVIKVAPDKLKGNEQMPQELHSPSSSISIEEISGCEPCTETVPESPDDDISYSNYTETDDVLIEKDFESFIADVRTISLEAFEKMGDADQVL